MGKKKVCPIGLICFDTKYIIILFVSIILFFVYFIHCENNKKNNLISTFDNNFNTSPKYHTEHKPKPKPQAEIVEEEPKIESRRIIVQNRDSYLVNKDYERVINPLLPPERRNHYIDPHSMVMTTPGVPINIPTRGHTGGVQQVGALYKQNLSDDSSNIGNNNEPVILPLFGRETYNGSNKWMYYTTTDKNNQVKIPISNKSKECNSEYGCEELYDGDNISIPAYNGDFKVNKYQFDKPRYIPYI
tara:strand:- start:255 stop:989 length:735 start_codon:yes stop_codon:yes gene_type:complete